MHRQQTSNSILDKIDIQKIDSKIEEVLQLLKGINSADHYKLPNPSTYSDTSKETLSADDFIVKIGENRTVINNKPESDPQTDQSELAKLQFLDEIERDAAKRSEERKQREAVAQNLRKMGNDAFRNGEYEKAISMYSKAIDHVKDSPVLYNNRALTYIRLGLFKKAIIDVDFVLQKLDEKNVRSWLFRAKSYYLLGETRDFEKSINEAKKNNPKDLELIEKTVADILANKVI